jgi:hypothetical protein
MRFFEDTQVDGRFFPKGAEVEVVPAGANALVLPDTDAYTTICAVPVKSLVPLKPFRVLLLNRLAGIGDAQIRLGTDEADVRSSIERRAPDCEVLEVEELPGSAV